MTTTLVDVNGRWPLLLPDHRAKREEWPWFEAARHAALSTVVSTGTVVYDIGSECGDFAGLVSSWGASVVMAEPNPRAWPSAMLVFEANGFRDPLATWPGFVGEFGLGIDAEDLEPWPASSEGEVVGDVGSFSISSVEEYEAVRVCTLDDLVAAANVWPDVISIDVEGAELHVLRGMANLMARGVNRPEVFVSIHPELAAARFGYGNIVETIRWLMCEYGYPHYGHTHLATDHEEHWWFRP